MLQLCPTATAPPMHVFVCEKSPGFDPLRPTTEICRALVPEFIILIVCGAAVAPCKIVPKSTLPGAIATLGITAIPVPEITAECGLPGALSITCTIACSAPVCDGVNSTLIEQFAFAASVAPHVLLFAKSPAFAPVTEIPFTARI